MPAPSQVAVRLGVDGSTEFKRTFADASSSAQTSLNKIGDAADAAATKADRAAARQAASYKRMAEAAREAERAARSQFAVNQGYAPALNGPLGGSARDSASVFEAHLREMDEVEARARRIRAEIDPLSAAQDRFAKSTKNADELLAKGAITGAEHAAAMKLAKTELAAVEKAAHGAANGLGLTHTQFQVLFGAAHHAADALVAGANPMRVLTMESVKAAPALGGLGNLAGLAGRLIFSAGGAAVAAAGAFAIAAKAGADYEEAFDKLGNAATGYAARWNTTAAALEHAAEEGSRTARISVGAARDMEAEFLHTGTIGAGVLEDLVGVSRKFSLAMGEEPKAAAKDLAKAFEDPAKGVRVLNEELGFLDAAEARHIEVLAQANDKTEAQKTLAKDLNDHLKTTEQHVSAISQLLQNASTNWSNFWTAAGKGVNRALGTLSLDERLAQDLAAREDYQPGTKAYVANETDIADLLAKIAARDAQAKNAKPNQDSETAADLSRSQLGYDQKDTLNTDLNKLLAGQKAGRGRMTAEDWRLNEQNIARHREAIASWIPPEEKRQKLLEKDAEFARTIDPAERKRIATQRAMIQSAGELKTAEERRREAQLAGEQAEGRADRRAERRAQTLGRELEAMKANAAASLDVADAYMKSTAAGEAAEARRKALTDATKKGGDVEAFVAAQRQVNITEAAATGAKTLAQLRDETAARRALNDQVLSGSLDAGDLAQALKTEQAVRLVVAAAAQAEGDAKTKLLAVAQGLREAEPQSQLEANRTALIQATDATNDHIAALKREVAVQGEGNRARAIALAQFEAEQKVKSEHLEGTAAGNAYVQAKTAEAGAQADAGAAHYASDTLERQRDQLALIQAEAATLGKTAAEREEILTRLKTEQELKRQGVDLTSKEGQEILKNAERIDEATRAYDRQKAAQDEIRSEETKLVDHLGDALSPEHWRDWRDEGRAVLADIEKEFLKLAILNPLKNLINGDDKLPTLGSVFGSLFGQGQGQAQGSSGGGFHLPTEFLASLIPGFAGGTDDAPGGWAWVGEGGNHRELAYLAKGSRVIPSGRSEALFREAMNARSTSGPTFVLNSPVMTQDLLDRMNAIGAAHGERAYQRSMKGARANVAAWNARAGLERGN